MLEQKQKAMHLVKRRLPLTFSSIKFLHSDYSLHAEIAGKTLVTYNDRSKSTVCKTHNRPLFISRKYELFSFSIPVFIYVGTLRFHLTVYAKLDNHLFLKFCEKKRKSNGRSSANCRSLSGARSWSNC